MSQSDNQLKAANERLELIAELHKTQGWQLFMNVLDGALAVAEHHLDRAKDPFEAWRFLHEVKSLKDLRSWSEREIKAAKDLIEIVKAEQAK